LLYKSKRFINIIQFANDKTDREIVPVLFQAIYPWHNAETSWPATGLSHLPAVFPFSVCEPVLPILSLQALNHRLM
jgi:hypothetical protein